MYISKILLPFKRHGNTMQTFQLTSTVCDRFSLKASMDIFSLQGIYEEASQRLVMLFVLN